MNFSFLAMILMAAQGQPVTSALPSAARCTAMFGVTLDQMKVKSGDPAMLKGFADDMAALRAIALADQKGNEAAADAAIATERNALRGAADSLDLKPCYRVKALGPLK